MRAGNINAVLPWVQGDLLLVLDTDHVASPGILEGMTGYFADDRVALSQSAHSFRNLNSVPHDESGLHGPSLFFGELIPGHNRLGSVFWCASVAVIGLRALREAVGPVVELATQVEIEVACCALDGIPAPARGVLSIASRSAVDTSGSRMRIGGPVTWNDDESRGRVSAYC